jgi:hypothetical protein
MAISCGRCKQKHDSVEEVKACYNGGTVPGEPQDHPASARATGKQVSYLSLLLSQGSLELTEGRQPDQIEKREASLLIDWVKGYLFDGKRLPAGVVKSDKHASEAMRSFRHDQLPDVPAGHYAVNSLTGNNDLDFFRVDRPEEGQWAGRTFVKRIVGGHPARPVRGTTMRQALDAIGAAGFDAARTLFGTELGRCWKCNKTLTDDLSRAVGIGPECVLHVYGCSQQELLGQRRSA